jgi:hypothetical protein
MRGGKRDRCEAVAPGELAEPLRCLRWRGHAGHHHAKRRHRDYLWPKVPAS